MPITAGFTGTWYDPAQSGHGIFIEVLPDDRMLAWWFTFTPDGTQQAWFGNLGTIDGDTATVAAVQTEGGRWIPNFDPSNVTQPAWGTLTFQFTDCNHGEVVFLVGRSGLGLGTHGPHAADRACGPFLPVIPRHDPGLLHRNEKAPRDAGLFLPAR